MVGIFWFCARFVFLVGRVSFYLGALCACCLFITAGKCTFLWSLVASRASLLFRPFLFVCVLSPGWFFVCSVVLWFAGVGRDCLHSSIMVWLCTVACFFLLCPWRRIPPGRSVVVCCPIYLQSHIRPRYPAGMDETPLSERVIALLCVLVLCCVTPVPIGLCADRQYLLVLLFCL